MSKTAAYKQPYGIDGGDVFGLNNIFKIIGIDLADTSQNRPWTPDGKEHLIELYCRGWTVDEMAKELNRTPGSIVGTIYDLGEAGKLSIGMWGSKSKDKQIPKDMFRLFGGGEAVEKT